MGVLDRLRQQARWKDRDPEVRAAAVADLGEDQQEALRSLARDDADARVRRAAVLRLTDPALLSELARGDADRRVRDEAREVLVILAAGDDLARAQAALQELDGPKHLARVARSALLDEVRRGALVRIEDGKALGSVARHATEASVRLQALRRIDDAAEIVQVATRSDYEDSALAALEAIHDKDALRAVTLRARHPAVVRRAREALAALEQAPRPPDPEVLKVRRIELCHSMEFLVHSENWDRARMQMAKTEERWREIEGQPDEDLARRFASAREAVAARISQDESERALQRHVHEEAEHAMAARLDLCSRVEGFDDEEPAEQLRAARAAWAALPPAAHPRLPALNRRFEAACLNCERRLAAREAARTLRARREEVCREAEAVAAAEDLAALQAHFEELRSAWSALRPEGDGDADLEERFREAAALGARRETDARQARLQAERENLHRLETLCGELEEKAKADGLTLKTAEQGLREVRSALDQPGPTPSKRHQGEILERLRKLKTALGSRLHDLLEIGEWKQWANANLQEELCARMEALSATPDLQRATRQIRDLERRWREVGGSRKVGPEALRDRYEKAHDLVRARCDAYLMSQAGEQAANLKGKEALCERAQALAESTDWVRTAEEVKRLQMEWKAIGPVPRDQALAIWQRFRAPCDRFFTRRKEDLLKRKDQWAQNQARKEALCARAEELAAANEWEKVVAEIKGLQAEWKTIGTVRRSRSETLGLRFRQACDRFFERFARREAIDREARQAEREAIVLEIEALLPLDGSATPPVPDGFAHSTLQARERWLKAGGAPSHVPADPVAQRFHTALARLVESRPEAFRGTDLDFDTTRRKMEQLCARVEGLLPAAPPRVEGGASPAAILAAHLREALASNTMGGRQVDEARWLAANEEVGKAQAAWQRLAPLPGETGHILSDRFEAACTRFLSQRPAPTARPKSAPAGKRPRRPDHRPERRPGPPRRR